MNVKNVSCDKSSKTLKNFFKVVSPLTLNNNGIKAFEKDIKKDDSNINTMYNIYIKDSSRRVKRFEYFS